MDGVLPVYPTEVNDAYWPLYALEKTLGQPVILPWPSCTLMHFITSPRRTELSRSPKYLPRATPGEMKTKTCSSLHRWLSAWCSKVRSQWKASTSRAGMAAPCWWETGGRVQDYQHRPSHHQHYGEWQIKAVKHTKLTWGASPARCRLLGCCSPLFLLLNTQCPIGNGQREIFPSSSSKVCSGVLFVL